MSNTETEVPAPDLKLSTVVTTAANLETIVRKILMGAGADQENALRVAEGLVSSDLCGVESHGVWQLPGYVERIKGGEINVTGKPALLSETSNTALISGNWSFGHVGAKFATEVAIDKALENNLSLVSLVQTHHIGRLGEYVELAASAGLISMIWAGGFSETAPAAAPFGGRKPILHTNPIAMAFPSNGRPSMTFDFATTALSGAKIHQARGKHKSLPLGSIVDRDGNPSTDPMAFFEGGAYLPFGGHKGYAFMLAAEYLGRIFTGSDDFAEPQLGGAIFGHSGATIIAFRANLFQPVDQYCRRSEDLETRIRAVPPAPGFREVLMPGDLEERARRTRRRDGIPLPIETWNSIKELAHSLGITDF